MTGPALRTRIQSAVSTWAGVAASVVVFLFAVRLLGTATGALTPTLQRLVETYLVSDPAALGVGWLAAAALGNGTVVAAVSLSLHASGLLTVTQLFLLVVGSRLGGAGIVLAIGALDSLRGRAVATGTTVGVGASLELGLLASALTAVVYLPTAVAGTLLTHPVVVDVLGRTAVGSGGTDAPDLALPTVFEPIAVSVTELVGAPLAALGAVCLVFVALHLVDRALESADTDRVRGLVTRWLDSYWRAALVGFAVTALATSVAFSLGMVVPLYNRGYLDRREAAPYVLGANVGTLADTLVVAALLGNGESVGVVLVVGAVAGVVTLVVLAFLDPVVRVVSAALDVVRRSAWHTLAALVGFLLLPTLFVVLG